MLAVLYGSAFVAAFNENIINVALVSIMNEFSVGADIAQWLVTGYMIVTAIVVTITAFLSRRLRLRTLFLLACGMLAGGSIAAIFAPNFAILLVLRLMQSIGTGIFIPIMMSTVLQVAPHNKMGTYLSIGGCMITFGPAFAPVVSGFMVTTFGWRSVFVPPAIIIVILALAGLVCIKNVSEPEDIKLDLVSVALSAAGLFLVVFGLSSLMSNPGLSLGTLAIGLVCVVIFFRRQRTISNPLLNLDPLYNRKFVPACLLVVIGMLTTFSMSVLLPLYFEGALGTTALVAGALLLAPILVNAFTSLIGGRAMDKRGCWPLLPIGFLLITLGQLSICLLATQMSWVAVLVGSIVVYAGVGLIFTPSQTAGLQTLTPEEHPHGVAIVNTFIQIAASIGPSLFIGVMSSVAASATQAGMTASFAQAQGFSVTVALACAIAALGLVVSIIYSLKRRRDASAATTQESKAMSAADLSVEAVMKSPYLVSHTATVKEVMQCLIDHKTSGLPVVDENDSIVGFVTDGDILAALSKQNPTAIDLSTGLALYRDMRDFEARFADALALNITEIATPSIVSVTTRTSIDEVCSILSTKKIKKVPVLEGSKVVGTISRSDVVRALMSRFVCCVDGDR